MGRKHHNTHRLEYMPSWMPASLNSGVEKRGGSSKGSGANLLLPAAVTLLFSTARSEINQGGRYFKNSCFGTSELKVEEFGPA